jgi:hypothetical protein
MVGGGGGSAVGESEELRWAGSEVRLFFQRVGANFQDS